MSAFFDDAMAEEWITRGLPDEASGVRKEVPEGVPVAGRRDENRPLLARRRRAPGRRDVDARGRRVRTCRRDQRAA